MSQCFASALNNELSQLYTTYLKEIGAKLASVDGLGGPFFMCVPDTYCQSNKKLMIVGQQTNGWGRPEDGVESLLALYRDFNLAIKTRFKKSPFWQASHRLYNEVNAGGPPGGFLWSNLVKVDVNCKRPLAAVEDLVSSLSLLPNEIRITRPEAVVFLTGPYYDDRLRRMFEGVQFEEIEPILLSRLIHPDLPVSTFRTYHPNFLWLKKRRDVISRIADLISANSR